MLESVCAGSASSPRPPSPPGCRLVPGSQGCPRPKPLVSSVREATSGIHGKTNQKDPSDRAEGGSVPCPPQAGDSDHTTLSYPPSLSPPLLPPDRPVERRPRGKKGREAVTARRVSHLPPPGSLAVTVRFSPHTVQSSVNTSHGACAPSAVGSRCADHVKSWLNSRTSVSHGPRSGSGPS